jgi:hypothetical protein
MARRDLDSQARLVDPAWPEQRQEPAGRVVEQLGDLGKLTLTAEKACWQQLWHARLFKNR